MTYCRILKDYNINSVLLGTMEKSETGLMSPCTEFSVIFPLNRVDVADMSTGCEALCSSIRVGLSVTIRTPGKRTNVTWTTSRYWKTEQTSVLLPAVGGGAMVGGAMPWGGVRQATLQFAGDSFTAWSLRGLEREQRFIPIWC